ncbi:MAG TPA: DUF1345 domain-containing protein [Gaiellaceae bacterium]|nr:DUF1345 domain-containing protein [Gaiellaceae bacterium]
MKLKQSRRGLAALRTVIAFVVGTAVLAGLLATGAEWAVAVSCGWGAMALVTVLAVWLRIYGMDAAATRVNAQDEDFSRPVADLITLTASVVSLIAIGYTLLEAGKRHGTDKALLLLLAIVVVALSWATVHTLYTLRYGDLYYGHPVGGIDFNEDDPPDYRDFGYLALTIGMTYQVSDTNLQNRPIRHTALRHALLSFVFGAVIVALAINTVASLLH